MPPGSLHYIGGQHNTFIFIDTIQINFFLLLNNICLDAKRKCGYYAWNNSVVEKVAKVDWVMMA